MRTKAVFSIILGAVFAIVAYFILQYVDPSLSYLTGSIGTAFSLLLFLYLVFYEKWSDKKYKEAEKCITSPVWLKINGNFKTGSTVRNGYVYFCDGGIAFISIDKKPHIVEEIILPDILRYESDGITRLNIYAKDNRVYVISSADIKAVMQKLREQEWIN